MRYYVIQESDISVGVAFCDPATAFYSLRAVTESLQTTFEALAIIVCSRYIRQEQGLKIVSYGPSDPGWMARVLELLCASGHWHVGDTGDCIETEMEQLISKYLAWSSSAEAMEQLQSLSGTS